MDESAAEPRLLSIAVPTRNRAGYLRACLDSVFAQTGVPFEVVVCDNASTDATAEVLAAAAATTSPWLRRVVVHRHAQDIGMVGNWNACLERMSGDCGVILSDDDLLHPGFAERMTGLFRAGGALIAFCQSRIIDGAGRPLPGYPFDRLSGGTVEPREFIRLSLHGLLSLFPSAVLFSLAAAKAGGGFAAIGNSADAEFRLRLVAASTAPIPYSAEPLVDYRVHPASLTFDRPRAIQGMVELARLRRLYGMPLRSDALGRPWIAAKIHLKRLPGLRVLAVGLRKLRP